MLNIGEFARYAGVSVRMLRHYDAIGLLTPTAVDPWTGYRSYDPALLGRANAIVALRGLGFSLAEVETLLEGSLDPTGIRVMLEERRQSLEAQIEADRARLDDIERRLRLMEGEESMDLEFTEKSLPALELAQITGRVEDTTEIGPRIGPMFGELVQKVVEAGEQPSHPGIAWYAGDGSGLLMGAGFERSPVPGTEVGTLEAVPRAITTIYRGSMEHIGDAWQALGAHVQAAGLEFGGPCREIYLHTDEADPEAWVTELQQPVV